MDDTFEVSVEADGKIRVNSPGGFSKEKHQDADEFLAFIQALAGGSVEVKQNKPSLANPHGHIHGHHHAHRH